MIGFIELVMILISAGIAGFTIWIWNYKTNWSVLKKAVITITVASGLIAATFIGIFMWAVSTEAGQAIGIEEVNKPLNKFEYTEITEAELASYPELNKRISIEMHNSDVKNRTEWDRTKNFLDKKWFERSNQFLIDEKDLEEELNKIIVTARMRDTFASEGYIIPENSYIRQDSGRWYVMRRFNLFSITDSEVEKELNRINITTGKDTGDIVPTKLRNTFASNGFSLPEDVKISNEDGEWIIQTGTGYTILKEEGKLNVYTGDEKTYEILREDGKFKIIYVGPQGNPIFKIREKYYRFTFMVI